MTYDAVAPPSGTTGSYDGNVWNPSSGDVSEAWFASATSQVLADATTSHAGGWAGIPGATPAVNLGTSNATLTTLLDDGTSIAAVQQACFAAGTLVLAKDGPRRIEDIKIGDEVLCKSDGDVAGPLLLRVVDRIFKHSPTALVNIHIDDLVVRSTANHPFWLEGKGWTHAAKLAPGDRVIGHDNRLHAVTELFDNGDVEPVFNFAVAEHHTYFVASADGAISALVHNDYKEHTKGARNSTKGNHQTGQSRMGADQARAAERKAEQLGQQLTTAAEKAANDADAIPIGQMLEKTQQKLDALGKEAARLKNELHQVAKGSERAAEIKKAIASVNEASGKAADLRYYLDGLDRSGIAKVSKKALKAAGYLAVVLIVFDVADAYAKPYSGDTKTALGPTADKLAEIAIKNASPILAGDMIEKAYQTNQAIEAKKANKKTHADITLIEDGSIDLLMEQGSVIQIVPDPRKPKP